MINYLYILLFLFILFILFILFKYFFKKRDSFSNNYTIILLGDSILNNSKYVKPGQSIEDILLKQCDCEVIVFAQDGAKIVDVYSQLDNILINFNTPNTYIFLSIGGNNILNNNEINTNDLFEKYKRLLNSIKSKLPETNIISLTLYYPADYKQYANIIKIWNSNIKKIINRNIIETDKLINNKIDIVYSIEPSFIGGQKIVNAIIQKIS